MPNATADPLSQVFLREIDRFIAKTIKPTSPGLYQDRRVSKRFHRSWPLFVTHLDEDPVVDISGTLDNISTKGIGFYCDSGFAVGTYLAVKLFWSDPHALRVPAVVRHNQMTQQGVLVGARFVLHDEDACELIQHKLVSWYG
ncbi:MAG: PilZ domain-containing protein [Phycisphaerales bacterium]|nr:PilZ domain-containing protein [Phycisphaerales bacterium]